MAIFYRDVVQWLEHEADNFEVVGSNPTVPTKKVDFIWIIQKKLLSLQSQLKNEGSYLMINMGVVQSG